MERAEQTTSARLADAGGRAAPVQHALSYKHGPGSSPSWAALSGTNVSFWHANGAPAR